MLVQLLKLAPHETIQILCIVFSCRKINDKVTVDHSGRSTTGENIECQAVFSLFDPHKPHSVMRQRTSYIFAQMHHSIVWQHLWTQINIVKITGHTFMNEHKVLINQHIRYIRLVV